MGSSNCDLMKASYKIIVFKRNLVHFCTVSQTCRAYSCFCAAAHLEQTLDRHPLASDMSALNKETGSSSS